MSLSQIIKKIEETKNTASRIQKWKRIIQNPQKHAILSERIDTCEWILKDLKIFEASQRKKLKQAEYDLKHVGEPNFVSYSRGHLIGYIRAKKEILG